MDTRVKEALAAARQSWLSGVRLSKQCAYGRRAPDPESLPHFSEAARLLQDVLNQCPDNPEALTMMSQVSECLLDYDAAIAFQNKAFESGEPKTKKAIKRIALLGEAARAWRELLLTPELLKELGLFLESKGVGPNDRSLCNTYEWLSKNVTGKADAVIASLEKRGAFTDFQVLANIVHG